MKAKYGKRSLIELTKCVDPRLVHIAMELERREDLPCDLTLFETSRTVEKQRENVANKVSQTMNSRHIPNSKGICNAMDIVPYINGATVWNKSAMDKVVVIIRQIVKDLGYENVIRFGADFKSFYDGYHVEIKSGCEL